MRSPLALPARPRAVIGATLLAAGAVVAATIGSAGPAQARSVNEVFAVRSAKTLQVYWRGNGHGHGMSQYGALGAARKGLSTPQILAFYYPGTRLTRLGPATLRVGLSGQLPDTTVWNNGGVMRLSGYGVLPAKYDRYRLVPWRAGFALQVRGFANRWVWQTIRTGLPARADFSSNQGWVEVTGWNGSTKYRGVISAVRSGPGQLTINRVSLDAYTEGVVPREMPASWLPAAVHAQAVAARTYAAQAMQSAHGTGNYDICDTSMCQVYGGMAHYTPSNQLLWTDDPAALWGNAGQILTYRGAAIFAQFSASNGGATVYGNEPYLPAKNDPYDSSVSGDPYLADTSSVPVADVAKAFHLRSVSSIQVTQRDGVGPWGGRMLAGFVNGVTPAGKPAHIAVTGFSLGAALGIWTDYLRVG